MINFDAKKQEWASVRIADIAEVFDGPHATPKTVDEGPVFLGIGALQDGSINLEETRHVTPQDYLRWTRRVVPKANDFVFSYETRLGAAALIPEGLDCCLGRRMGLARLDKDKVDPRFFLYQYQSPQFQDFLRARTIRGATVDRISIKDFPKYPILLPSKVTQRRIVAVLDEASEAIDLAKSNSDRNLTGSRKLLTRFLDVAFVKLANTTKGFPIREIADIRGGKRTPNGYKLEVSPTPYPYLRVADFSEDGSIDQADLRYVSEGVHADIKRYVISSYDLYLSIAGTIGKTGIIPAELEGAHLTENACRLVFKDGMWNRFFYLFTRTGFFAEQIGLNTRTTAQPKLALSRLATIMVPQPPIEEQRKLVAESELISLETDRLSILYRQKLAALEDLKLSLLHQAFSGNL